MDELKMYLKSLKTPERHAYAARVGTSLSYLRKAMCIEQRNMHPKTCALLEKESGGKVTRQDLRPDDWQEIWPELAEKKH